jgi:hypothetical protein
MSKYLVTRATGGLGSQVVEFLLQRIPAEKIVALTRDPKKLQAFDYHDAPVAEFVSARVKEGFPEPEATFFAAWFQAIAAGAFAEVPGDLEKLIGRKPQSAEEFISIVYRV